MKCHYGIELPADGSDCKRCGATSRGQSCGMAWYGGYREGYDAPTPAEVAFDIFSVDEV